MILSGWFDILDNRRRIDSCQPLGIIIFGLSPRCQRICHKVRGGLTVVLLIATFMYYAHKIYFVHLTNHVLSHY